MQDQPVDSLRWYTGCAGICLTESRKRLVKDYLLLLSKRHARNLESVAYRSNDVRLIGMCRVDGHSAFNSVPKPGEAVHDSPFE